MSKEFIFLGLPITNILWPILLFPILYKTYKGAAPKRYVVTHGIILCFLVLANSNAFNMLGWATSNTHQIIPQFYVAAGFLPPWATFSSWLLTLIISPIALINAFGMAYGKPTARSWFIRLLPIFFLSAIL